ncbi:hypothetical protein BCR35DRAFT_323378 [Leucosporidium creatinivorum]|uniref:Amine oxidase n=1 Tax=Leucosporidium creatinivorum TaxID=106004 RepID=A0A1Y2G2M6_9BASI|nr:hypothetical protein BCR35DRAFT_323378 [Leucosporidium creatinivorum]
MTRTKEGFQYIKATGQLTQGFECEGAVSPASSFRSVASSHFDLIVIGAGYAGLVAARDATLSGLSVLLLEARDRVGGRTWTAKDSESEIFEMGGTWVHPQQGFVWRELHRYGIDRDIKITPNEDYPSHAVNVTRRKGVEYRQGFAENFDMLDAALARFMDIDVARSVVPFPPHILDSIASDPLLVAKYDKMSVADRVREVEAAALLTEQELGYIIPFIELSFGALAENCSYLEWIKWYIHGNCSYRLLADMLWVYKLKNGQSHLARKIFDEANSTGRLSYSFENVVQKVIDRPSSTKVVTSRGTFCASRVISTLPLNVASKVEFDPPLSALRLEAFAIGHVNKGHKIHNELMKKEFKSGVWNLADDLPLKRHLAAGFGDQILQNGNSTVVAFGLANDPEEVPSKDPSQIPRWLGNLDKSLEQSYVGSIWHEWIADPFAEGTWAMAPPGFTTKYHKELQTRTGNVLWASADWADGWKGFIDGACEQGGRAAHVVVEEWRAGFGRSKL